MLHHTAGTATVAEASSLSAKGHEPLVVTTLAADSEETMLKAATLEVVGQDLVRNGADTWHRQGLVNHLDVKSVRAGESFS